MHHSFVPIPLSIRIGESSVTPFSTLSARSVRLLPTDWPKQAGKKMGGKKTIFLIFLPFIFLPAGLGISHSRSPPRPGVRVLLPSFSCQSSQNMTRRGIARFDPFWQSGGTLWRAKALFRHVGGPLLHAKHPSRCVGGTLWHEKALFRRFGGFSPGAGSPCP
jgi:hypothetical protein